MYGECLQKLFKKISQKRVDNVLPTISRTLLGYLNTNVIDTGMTEESHIKEMAMYRIVGKCIVHWKDENKGHRVTNKTDENLVLLASLVESLAMTKAQEV
jgi:hypothetical protein